MGWTRERVAAAAGAYLLLLAMHPATTLVYLALRAIAHRLPGLTFALHTLYFTAETLFTFVYPLLVLVGTLFGGAVAVLRIWRRSPAGTAGDPLIQLRDAVREHRQLRSALPWLPFAYWLYQLARGLPEALVHDYDEMVSLPLVGVATTIIGKLLLRALDRIESREAPPPPQVAADETVFRAVAVTPRAQAIVGGALAVALGMIGFICSVKLSTLGLGRLSMLVLVYATILGVTARWFQLASTIRVGTDGVFVQGTSKTRFYAYRGFDSARVSGATMHLVRGGKTVVRLQLHGADLHRGAFLAERIEAALASAKNVSGAETLLGHGANALGTSGYRDASLTREQLWELLEADGTAGEARIAAAQLLATNLAAGERARLRVAAAHTVHPRVRIALETLAEDEDVAEGALTVSSEVAQIRS